MNKEQNESTRFAITMESMRVGPSESSCGRLNNEKEIKSRQLGPLGSHPGRPYFCWGESVLTRIASHAVEASIPHHPMRRTRAATLVS